MKKDSIFIKHIKNMTGNVLMIGDFSDKVLDELSNNDNINCNILSTPTKSSKEKGRREKLFHLSKLRSFKKKRIDYLVCDYNKLNNYLKSFVKDSIYITKGKIYIDTFDLDKIKKLYSRYDVKIKSIKCSDKSDIIIIDVERAKNNLFKESFYRVVDFISFLIDTITNLLIN